MIEAYLVIMTSTQIMILSLLALRFHFWFFLIAAFINALLFFAVSVFS